MSYHLYNALFSGLILDARIRGYCTLRYATLRYVPDSQYLVPPYPAGFISKLIYVYHKCVPKCVVILPVYIYIYPYTHISLHTHILAHISLHTYPYTHILPLLLSGV